jgi:hypothetical protein
MIQAASVKALALHILEEMIAQRMKQKACPASTINVGQNEGQDAGTLKLQEGMPLCGSLLCAGCYDVGDGRKIHPPKVGEDYRKWLERWKPIGRPQ